MPKAKTTKAKKPAEVDEIEEVEETAAPAEETEGKKSTEVDSIDVVRGEIFIRQYSQKIHGDDFIKLAEEFCSKKVRGRAQYTIVPSDQITKVEVRYREKADAHLHLDKQKPDAPMEDKIEVFTDKEKAVAFGATKFASTVVVSKRK